MKKLYFRNIDDDRCYPLSYHLENAKEEELKEVTLFEAIPDKDKNYFWCKAVDEVCMIDSSCIPCGKECEEYNPCNGKSGKCKHKSFCRTWGEEKTFKVK